MAKIEVLIILVLALLSRAQLFLGLCAVPATDNRHVKLTHDPSARLKDVELSAASVMSEELARMSDLAQLLMTEDFYSATI